MIKELNHTKEFLEYLQSLPTSKFNENSIEIVDKKMNKIHEEYPLKNLNSIISANNITLI
jgi:hypothetical protein